MLEKDSLILLILSEKKNNKMVGKTYLRVIGREYFFQEWSVIKSIRAATVSLNHEHCH